MKDNGWIDPYPHEDLETPCTLPCCVPEAYGPNPWTCDDCGTQLKKPGVCIDCVPEVITLQIPKRLSA